MSLDQIEVKGFKTIRSLVLDLRNLNVLIGANGAGKTNFISLFALIQAAMKKSLRGAVLAGGGADRFLFFGQKETARIELRLRFNRDQNNPSHFTNTYACEWAPTESDTLFFESERCYFHKPPHPSPYQETIGCGSMESQLPDFATSNPKTVPDFLYHHLSNCMVYHFHDTSPSAKVKKPCPIGDHAFLRPDAANLGAFLLHLKANFSANYQAIRGAVSMVAPFFDDFVLRPNSEDPNQIILQWQDSGSDIPFRVNYLSDGTLRFICLATLLLQPDLPGTVLIDEPELGLHPFAINVLVSLLRTAAQRTQVIVSTQSVTLINQLDPEDLIVVERNGRETSMKRLESKDLTSWVELYSLGELWEKNVIGGRPGP